MPRQFMLVCSHELQIYPPSITSSPPPTLGCFFLGGGDIQVRKTPQYLKTSTTADYPFHALTVGTTPLINKCYYLSSKCTKSLQFFFSFFFWWVGVTTVKSHKIRPRLPILAHTPYVQYINIDLTLPKNSEVSRTKLQNGYQSICTTLLSQCIHHMPSDINPIAYIQEILELPFTNLLPLPPWNTSNIRSLHLLNKCKLDKSTINIKERASGSHNNWRAFTIFSPDVYPMIMTINYFRADSQMFSPNLLSPCPVSLTAYMIWWRPHVNAPYY